MYSVQIIFLIKFFIIMFYVFLNILEIQITTKSYKNNKLIIINQIHLNIPPKKFNNKRTIQIISRLIQNINTPKIVDRIDRPLQLVMITLDQNSLIPLIVHHLKREIDSNYRFEIIKNVSRKLKTIRVIIQIQTLKQL